MRQEPQKRGQVSQTDSMLDVVVVLARWSIGGRLMLEEFMCG